MSQAEINKIKAEVKEKQLAKIRWQWFKEYKKHKNVSFVCRITALVEVFSIKNPRGFSEETIKLILKIRKRTKRGAEYIWFELKDRYPIHVSVTGVYKILKRNRLIRERRSHSSQWITKNHHFPQYSTLFQ
ncbi:MAG: hypothetical protein O3B47_03710 [bacterium]|nr:hypothetical protein [bacterium]